MGELPPVYLKKMIETIISASKQSPKSFFSFSFYQYFKLLSNFFFFFFFFLGEWNFICYGACTCSLNTEKIYKKDRENLVLLFMLFKGLFFFISKQNCLLIFLIFFFFFRSISTLFSDLSAVADGNSFTLQYLHSLSQVKKDGEGRRKEGFSP